MAIPFLVIRYASKEIWGGFVALLLYILMASQLAGWGNKEYLMRRFSLAPNKINADYSAIFFTRSPLIILLSMSALFFFPPAYFFPLFLWLSGRYFTQSAEVLVIYEKKFVASLLIEMVCFGLFVIAFSALKSGLDLFRLLLIYGIYQFIKGICFCLLFRNFIALGNFRAELSYFKAAFPFFLLSVFGFLVSKIDVYIVTCFTGEATTADYQVINSLLVFIVSASVFIYTPFTKNIYRNSESVVRKVRLFIAFSGLAIIPVALIVVRYVLSWYLDLEFSFWFYLIAFLYVFPPFIYGIRIIGLFKRKQEKKVILYLFVVAALNAMVSALLLASGYGIIGALAGGAAAQLLSLYLFSRH